MVPINYKISTIEGGARADTATLRSSSNWISGFGFRSHHPGVVQFLFADGRVQSLKESVNRNVYRYLSTRDQGEVVSADQF